MTKFHMMNTLTYFDHPKPQAGRAVEDEEASEVAFALEIAGRPGLTQAERLRVWEVRTGLSRPTSYRRLEKAGCADEA